jgi:predicted metal-binding protein
MNIYQEFKSELKKVNKNIEIYNIKKEQIIFEKRVLLNCFYCSKYSRQWTCPPNIPKIDYVEMINEYDNILIIGCSYKTNEDNYSDIRYKSTNEIHKSLLILEKVLWKNNFPMAISFIGGSCKLCKNGCAEDKCRNPSKARIPIEATGINVIKTLENINIKLDFSNNLQISRYGMILW